MTAETGPRTPPEDVPVLEHAPRPRDETGRPAWARLYDRLTEGLFTVAMVLMLLAMTLLIGLDVILRVFFSTPIRGTHDLVGLSLLLLFLLALPHSWRGDHHVRMDMIYTHFSPRVRLVVDLLAGATAIVFAALLAWQAYRYIPSVMRVGSASVTLRIPYWPFTVAIMVSAALFAVSIVQDLIATAIARKKRA